MLDRKIFVVILMLMTMLVISLKYNPNNLEGFTTDEQRIDKIELLVKNLNDSFNSTIDILSKQKFQGFEGPKGDMGEMGPAGGSSLVHQTLTNLNKPKMYANITMNNNGINSKVFMAYKTNSLSNYATSEQLFQYTDNHQIKPKGNTGNCLTHVDGNVYMDKCNDSTTQKWFFDKNTLKPANDEGKCLSLESMENNNITRGTNNSDIFKNKHIDTLTAVKCDTTTTPIPDQHLWNFR